MRVLAVMLLASIGGCAGGPPPSDWQLNSAGAIKRFQQHYLNGDTRLAETEFGHARAELSRTGRGDLLARAELVRCATRAASLEFDECPGFEALRSVAGPEEISYAAFLAGRGEHAASDDPLSKLVAAGVLFRTTRISPAQIGAAAETASAQGWRRPLLAWLGVQAKRAEAAGNAEALRHIRRRIELIGPDKRI